MKLLKSPSPIVNKCRWNGKGAFRKKNSSLKSICYTYNGLLQSCSPWLDKRLPGCVISRFNSRGGYNVKLLYRTKVGRGTGNVNRECQPSIFYYTEESSWLKKVQEDSGCSGAWHCIKSSERIDSCMPPSIQFKVGFGVCEAYMFCCIVRVRFSRIEASGTLYAVVTGDFFLPLLLLSLALIPFLSFSLSCIVQEWILCVNLIHFEEICIRNNEPDQIHVTILNWCCGSLHYVVP